MKQEIEVIKKAIQPLKEQIVNHKIYSAINSIEDVKIFMQYHVFAVWDFMSLLKTLQNKLTCTTIPWFPSELNDACYLINEIVTGEESDIDSFGNRKSHFQLYLDAMKQCEADISPIQIFSDELKKTRNLTSAFDSIDAPIEVRNFVNYTFKIINSGTSHLPAAVFTFGREDLIPQMFISMVKDMDSSFPESISIFKYYLERHIEVDGDNHSPLALQMTEVLCGDNQNYWSEALPAIEEALRKRIELWDGAYKQIILKVSENNVTNNIL